MNCAASAAHAVILMLWTSDCRAGDYRQLLYPARWRQYRLLPIWLRRRAAWCDWFVWCGPVVRSGVGFATCPRVVCPGMWKKEGARWWCPLPVRFGCGGVLLSHTLPGAVPSPCQVLASGFGMGPGVSPGPWPPQILCYTSHGIVSPRVPLGDRGGLGTG